MIDVNNLRFDSDFRVYLAQVVGGRNHFRQPIGGVGFGEHRLSLQVREFDKVSIYKAQFAGSGPRQRLSLGRAQRAAADDQNARSQQTLLTLFTDAGKENLPAITIVLRLRHSYIGPRRVQSIETLISRKTTARLVLGTRTTSTG